jgi:hypothetical protein
MFLSPGSSEDCLYAVCLALGRQCDHDDIGLIEILDPQNYFDKDIREWLPSNTIINVVVFVPAPTHQFYRVEGYGTWTSLTMFNPKGAEQLSIANVEEYAVGYLAIMTLKTLSQYRSLGHPFKWPGAQTVYQWMTVPHSREEIATISERLRCWTFREWGRKFRKMSGDAVLFPFYVASGDGADLSIQYLNVSGNMPISQYMPLLYYKFPVGFGEPLHLTRGVRMWIIPPSALAVDIGVFILALSATRGESIGLPEILKPLDGGNFIQKLSVPDWDRCGVFVWYPTYKKITFQHPEDWGTARGMLLNPALLPRSITVAQSEQDARVFLHDLTKAWLPAGVTVVQPEDLPRSSTDVYGDSALDRMKLLTAPAAIAYVVSMRRIITTWPPHPLSANK